MGRVGKGVPFRRSRRGQIKGVHAGYTDEAARQRNWGHAQWASGVCVGGPGAWP